MLKSDVNAALRNYAQANLSPTKEEQSFISSLYDSVGAALPGSTIQIGSYPRYTAIRPLHDLDVLYVAGSFDSSNLDPANILDDLRKQIDSKFENPTPYAYKISQQTHSITVAFVDGEDEIFCVDIVPAYIAEDRNDYGEETYWVPEILKYSPRNRRTKYELLNASKSNEREWWIKSDPRGYIKAASTINQVNSDFRKTVKLVKRWKHNCKDKFGEFKLKSFHIEQGIYKIFCTNPEIEIGDAIFEFFSDIPEFISLPQIPDRADNSKYIDEYLEKLTATQKEVIVQARDAFLIKFENLEQGTNMDSLLEAEKRKRASEVEEYLFDQGIPTYIDPRLKLTITGKVLERDGGFRQYILDVIGKILADRRIEFRVASDNSNADYYKWKVKNDDGSPQPRGEITDHRTLRDPEHTQFKGSHYVECYAIRDGVCVARAKQNVVL